MAFTIGIEEEYLLTDTALGHLVLDPPQSVFAQARQKLGEQVTPEMLRAQIEIGTRPHENAAALREELVMLRRGVGEVAHSHGISPIAAGTHPFGDWSDSLHTEKQRYADIVNDLQQVGRRLLICGMHVHVQPPDPAARIDLMNRVLPYLPLLLALGTSSPFWRGEDTGLQCYRLAIYDELPRTGLPEIFADEGEYRRYVAMLVGAGIIPDASMVWWAIRPSRKFPTLELRVADSVTDLDDGIAIAQLYRCLLRLLWRRKDVNAGMAPWMRLLIDENRWRAQRYGVEGDLLEIDTDRMVKVTDYLDHVLALVQEDMDFFDCRTQVERCRDIVRRGTSAQHQRQVFEQALAEGHDKRAALRAVVHWLQQASFPAH